jgi:type I restriction enzyme S subunit
MREPPIDVRPQEWGLIEGILDRIVPGRTVWAFGSRVHGTAKPFSDLDLAILGDTPLPLPVAAALREAFSESDLPYKVDVVEWATTTPGFRAVIERSHIVLRQGDALASRVVP